MRCGDDGTGIGTVAWAHQPLSCQSRRDGPGTTGSRGSRIRRAAENSDGDVENLWLAPSPG